MDCTVANKTQLIQDSFSKYINLAFEISELEPSKFLVSYSQSFGKHPISSEVAETKSSFGSIDFRSTESCSTPSSTEQASPDFEVTQTFGRISLKLFMNEPISTEDCAELDPIKLSNLRKLVFVRYQKLIEISFSNQVSAKNSGSIERLAKNAQSKKKRRKLQVPF